MSTGTTFVAAYHGTCGGCGDPISPGDECTYVRETSLDPAKTWHLDCASDAPIPARVPQVCPTCRLTGPCDCEPWGAA